MTFSKKLLIVAMVGIAVFLFQGIVGTTPAQAALYKFTFTGDSVNGYFIYDDSVKGQQQSPYAQGYSGGRDYKIDLGDKGVFQGPVSNAIVFLVRQEDETLSKLKAEHDKVYGEVYGKDEKRDLFLVPRDLFLLQIRGFERQPKSKYTLVSYFKYPVGTFHGSTELPTGIPSNAEVEIFPKVEFPMTLGEAVFKGPVQTKIEKISD